MMTERQVWEAAQRLLRNHPEIRERANCYLCGRSLYDPSSITRGIGPACWRQILIMVEQARQRVLRRKAG